MAVIQDVAKMANVSVATVSRVMNDSTNVLPETAKKVLEAMETLNYHPNTFSRNLRLNKSGMILVALPEFSNPFWGDVLEGIDQEAQRHGYNLLVYPTHSNPEQEQKALALLQQKRADGALMLSPVLSLEKLMEADKNHPIVQCCEYKEGGRLPHVSVNNYVAEYQAVEHFIKLGHRRIAMISSTNGFISTIQRENGYRKALEDSGIAVDEKLILRGSYSFDSGYEKAAILLNYANRPTAIVTVSDTIAAGCLCAIQEADLLCPKDVAVIGFDNISMSKMLYPKLSTINQPRRRIGETAIEILLERLNGSNECRQLFLPHELVIRQSS
jgi:LacI family repressor for deo operon, udp, cdd, tsx, nupC, and nupG